MEFTLVYRGDIAPRAKKAEIWKIRAAFDEQLRRLWRYEPLSSIDKYRDPNYRPNDCYLGSSRGGIEFIPIVSDRIKTVVRLRIKLLSANYSPGALINSGDIDNRLKVLIDALRAPASEQEIPSGTKSPADGRVYCLMEDDKHVVGLNVVVERLLDADAVSRESLAIIDVHVRASAAIWANIGVAS